MTKRSKRPVCPHCGNRDEDKIESNGTSEKSVDFTLLCVARVKPTTEALADFEPRSEPGSDGMVACGMQWCPNA